MNTDRAEGILLGLACGDALGRPVEFHTPAQIANKHGTLTEMIGHGTHNQPTGTVTDDTDMALCIARSLVERGEFDPENIARRFVEWYESGPFDIGLMTSDALRRISTGKSWDEAGQDVWEESTEGSNAGNGSVMRCAPLAITYASHVDRLQRVSRDTSRITHADPRCTHGCALLNLTLAEFLEERTEPLATALDELDTDAPTELVEAAEPLTEPDTVSPETLANTGYVVDTLRTALYHALSANSAEAAIVAAVNEGGDADTIGAVAGAVAGARFGASALPARWTDALIVDDDLRRVARQLSRRESASPS